MYRVKQKETQLQMLKRLTSGPKSQALAWLRPKGTGPSYPTGVVVREALSEDVLEQISWLIPNFEKIHFSSVELLEDSAFYYLNQIRKFNDHKLLGELNYQHRHVSDKEFPHEGAESSAVFLKRMLKRQSFPGKHQPRLSGDEWRGVATACIAFRARWLPTRPEWQWRAPDLTRGDKNLRAPRITGVLYTMSDWDLIRQLCELVGSRYFSSVDLDFLGYYKRKMQKKLSQFRFDTLKDRVHAERLSLTDFELVQRLATILLARDFSPWEYSFILGNCVRAHRFGPERFSLPVAFKERFYGLFEKSVVQEEALRLDRIKFINSELARLGYAKVPFGAVPAQKCLLDGGLSKHESFIEGEFQEVEVAKVNSSEVDKFGQLDFTEILLRPWNGKGDTQYLFGEPTPSPWDGDAVQGEMLFQLK